MLPHDDPRPSEKSTSYHVCGLRRAVVAVFLFFLNLRFFFLGLDFKTGPLSPSLLSVVTKRFWTPTEVTVTSSNGRIRNVSFSVKMSGRDLGSLNAPSRDTPDEDLLSLLSDSPYFKLLSSTSWVEIPQDEYLPKVWDELLYGCWFLNPALRYATAVLFAGCVIFNPRNKNGAICLVAESYGRDPGVDIHREKAVSVGESVSSISQPSTLGLYPHATICRVQHDKSDHRLVIGCKGFNLLVTQLWRLGKDSPSERAFTAGCCSSAFPLYGSTDIRIFIDQRSLDRASKIASHEITPRFEVENLRQLRSRFCWRETYLMARASSHFIRNMMSAKVVTVFTLGIVSQGSGDACLVSLFLGRLAKEVHAQGEETVLKKELVSNLLSQVKSGKDIEKLLRKILDLFQDNEEIRVFDRKRSLDLEELLNSLAEDVSGYLKNCNEKVVVPQLTQEMARLSW